MITLQKNAGGGVALGFILSILVRVHICDEVTESTGNSKTRIPSGAAATEVPRIRGLW